MRAHNAINSFSFATQSNKNNNNKKFAAEEIKAARAE